MNYIHLVLLCCITATSLWGSEKARYSKKQGRRQQLQSIFNNCLNSMPQVLVQLITSYDNPVYFCGMQKMYKDRIHGIAYDQKTSSIALAIHKKDESQHGYLALDVHREMHCCSIEIWGTSGKQKEYSLPSTHCCYLNGLSLHDGNLAILSYFISSSDRKKLILYKNRKWPLQSTLEPTEMAAITHSSELAMSHDGVFSVDSSYRLYRNAQVLHQFPIFQGGFKNMPGLPMKSCAGVARSQDTSITGFVCSRKVPIAPGALDLQQISEVYVSPFPLDPRRNIIKYDFVQDNESWGPVKIALHSGQKSITSALLSRSGELRLYDVESDKSFESYRVLRNPSKCTPNGMWYDFDTSGWYITHTPLTFSHCGNYLLEQSSAHQLIVWDVKNCQELEKISIDNEPFVFHLAQDNTLHIGDSNGCVHRYVLG